MIATTAAATRRTHTVRFLRHFGEMLVAMLAGMAVFGVLFELVFQAAGTSWSALHYDAPAFILLLMAFNMTVPMVGWMAYRGHSRIASVEMAGSMFVPTFGVVGLLAGGLLTDAGVLMTIQHVVMIPAMLAVMLWRREEYTH